MFVYGEFLEGTLSCVKKAKLKGKPAVFGGLLTHPMRRGAPLPTQLNGVRRGVIAPNDMSPSFRHSDQHPSKQLKSIASMWLCPQFVDACPWFVLVYPEKDAWV